MKWRKKGENIDNAEMIIRTDPASKGEKDDYLKNLDRLMYGLVVKLNEYKPKEGGKQPTIKVECPAKLKYAEVLKVMDVMRHLKFKNVGLVPVPANE